MGCAPTIFFLLRASIQHILSAPNFPFNLRLNTNQQGPLSTISTLSYLREMQLLGFISPAQPHKRKRVVCLSHSKWPPHPGNEHWERTSLRCPTHRCPSVMWKRKWLIPWQLFSAKHIVAAPQLLHASPDQDFKRIEKGRKITKSGHAEQGRGKIVTGIAFRFTILCEELTGKRSTNQEAQTKDPHSCYLVPTISIYINCTKT